MKLESFKERWMGGGFPKRSSSVDSELEDSRIDEPSLRLQFSDQSSSPQPTKHDTNMNTHASPDANVTHDNDHTSAPELV